MRLVAAPEIDRALAFPLLIDALADAFRGDAVVPERAHHDIERSGSRGTLLVMPAWAGAPVGGYLGIKVVTIFPDNAAKGLPTLSGSYVLLDGGTGEPLAVLDGARLTLWRTAAASALAARFLARADATRMVMVGAGSLAPFLVRAHAGERSLQGIRIWNRSPERAAALARALAEEGLPVTPVDELEPAVREADIVTCATLATTPILRGAWLKPGAHLDLVGAFTPRMREADDEALRRSSIFVDTPGARTEGGDVTLALRSGAIQDADIRGDLAGLCRGEVEGRRVPDEITVFKSVGHALEDLAAAIAVWRAAARPA